MIPPLKSRKQDSHKGSFGTVLVIAGSAGMSGAAVLSGSAALRGGAGLVCVACPAIIQPEVAIGNPCFTTSPLERLASSDLLKKATSIVIGPGLRPSQECLSLLNQIFQTGKPVVIDADALNSIALFGMPKHEPSPCTLMTPHPGEFSRLTGLPTSNIQSNRSSMAKDFAQQKKITLVLKGHGTIVTNGNELFINSTGNPGMATGGTGDVLAGLLGALLAQGYNSMEAGCLGTYLHGLAGDLAAEQLGEYSLTAKDILDYLPKAFVKHQAES